MGTRLGTTILRVGGLLAAIAICAPAAAQDISVMPIDAPFDAEKAMEAARAREDAWLDLDFAAALAALESGTAIEATFGDAEAAALEAEMCSTCGNGVSRRYPVGVNKPAEAEVDLAAAGKAARGAYAAAGGGVATLDEKGCVRWTLAVSTPGASASRLHIENLHLPVGVEMRTFGTSDLDVFGPYPAAGPVGDGTLWTHTVAGDAQFLEVRATAPEFNGLLDRLSFRIAEVAVFSPERFTPPGAEAGDKRCSYNASCVQNAECRDSGDYPAIESARGATAHIVFTVGSTQYICSGGLLNDTGSTFTPYFLTANHCFSSQASATSAEFYFDYRRSSCGAGCGDPSPSDRSLGAVLLASQASSDFTFLRLSGALPPGRSFLGWTSAQVHNQINLALYRISHPLGAPQSYSRHRVISPAGTCGGVPLGNFLYLTDTDGATEGGSSGAPVANANGQVVGQLFGACGLNLNDVCDNVSNYTVDGAFRNTFETVDQWLVSCVVDSISPTAATWPGGGVAQAAFDVNVSGDCAWNAVSNSAWIVLNSSSGRGDGQVVYSLLSNATPSQRVGTITVGLQTFTVTQPALACSPTGVNPAGPTVPKAGATGVTVQVLAQAGCQWTAAAGPSWIALTSSTGTGNGSIAFNVAANAGASRTGSIIVGTRVVTVNQEAGSLVADAFYGAIAPAYANVDAPLFGGMEKLFAPDPKTGNTLAFDPEWDVDASGLLLGMGEVELLDPAKGAIASREVPLYGKMRFAASATGGAATWKNSASLKGVAYEGVQKVSASLKGNEAFGAAVASPDALLGFANFPGFGTTASLAFGATKGKAATTMTNVKPSANSRLAGDSYTVAYNAKGGTMSGTSKSFGAFPQAAGTLSGKVAWTSAAKAGTVQIKMAAGGFTASNRGTHNVTFDEFSGFPSAAPLEQRWTPTTLSMKSGGTIFSWK